MGTGLGFDCHLVQLVARYLGVPLQAQIRYQGSRSHILDPMNRKKVWYPLYTAGNKDRKIECDRAWKLLGYNIRQLVRACKIKCSDSYLEDLFATISSFS